MAAVGRRVITLCKGEDGLRQQLVLFRALSLCLPHASVRVPLAEPVPTNGTGSAKQWQPRTPAMAAGLTDHVDLERGPAVPRAAMATASDGVSKQWWWAAARRGPEQAMCIHTTCCKGVIRAQTAAGRR